jgi:hypothetical protein
MSRHSYPKKDKTPGAVKKNLWNLTRGGNYLSKNVMGCYMHIVNNILLNEAHSLISNTSTLPLPSSTTTYSPSKFLAIWAASTSMYPRMSSGT